MYRLLSLVMFVILVTPHASLAKKFTRCGLAAELKKHGIKDLRNWLKGSPKDGGGIFLRWHLPTRLHGAKTQKNSIIILTAVKTSKLAGVCMAESESGLNSNIVGKPNRDGSLDYGIFQINNKYWCKNGRKGGDCNIKCEDLKNDNIADDIKCAKKIYNRHGFSAWYGWSKKCQSDLPNLSNCRI